MLNPTDYQVKVNGQPKLVSDMTTDELRQALCQYLDAFDDIQVDLGSISEAMDKFEGNGFAIDVEPAAEPEAAEVLSIG